MSEEERRAAATLGRQALVQIATRRISRQDMINAAREACIAFRWRFGSQAMRRLAERTNSAAPKSEGPSASGVIENSLKGGAPLMGQDGP